MPVHMLRTLPHVQLASPLTGLSSKTRALSIARVGIGSLSGIGQLRRSKMNTKHKSKPEFARLLRCCATDLLVLANWLDKEPNTEDAIDKWLNCSPFIVAIHCQALVYEDLL